MQIPVGARRATINAYDIGGAVAIVLYVATVGHVTLPTDTPANTYFDECLKQPGTLKRDIFDSGTTAGRSRTGFGDVVLSNADGRLDAWVNYAFDGRKYSLERMNALGAWVPEMTAYMEQPEHRRKTVTVKLRDRQMELDTPFQTTKYLGNNALPAGLEGVASDLKGKPKPIVLGAALNVPPPCVNTPKLIHQVNDGPVAEITNIYDRGIRLSGGNWPAAASVEAHFAAVPVDIWSCFYANGVYLMGGYGISRSTDRVTWSALVYPFGGQIGEFAYSPTLDRFLVVGSANAAASSDDGGLTWVVRATGMAAFNPASLAVDSCWSPDQAQFVVIDSTGLLAYSPNGTTTWTVDFSLQAVLAGAAAQCIEYANGQYIVTCTSNKIAISPDAIHWVLIDVGLPVSSQLFGIAYGKLIGSNTAQWVICGSLGVIITSVDGRSWRQCLSNVPLNGGGNPCTLRRIVCTGNFWLATGQDGTMVQSSDTTTPWMRVTSGFGASYAYDICWDNDTASIFAVGVGSKYAFTTGYGTYASQADLLDDTKQPAPGTAKVYLAGGYFRLGSSPAGQVTADVLEGATAADRTTAQLFKRTLVRKGYTGADYSAADITALDAASAAVCGGYFDTEINTSAVLDQIASSPLAWWGVDQFAVFRIQQFTAPSGAAVASFINDDILKDSLDRLIPNDPSRGIPPYRHILRWGRNYTVQAADLAGVTPARRAIVSEEWREATFTDATVQTAHLLAPQMVEYSLFANAADALAEATRRQGLRGVRRDLLQQKVKLDDSTAGIDLFNVINDKYPRFLLNAGKDLRVLGVDPDPDKKELTLMVWG